MSTGAWIMFILSFHPPIFCDRHWFICSIMCLKMAARPNAYISPEDHYVFANHSSAGFICEDFSYWCVVVCILDPWTNRWTSRCYIKKSLSYNNICCLALMAQAHKVPTVRSSVGCRGRYTCSGIYCYGYILDFKMIYEQNLLDLLS